MRTLIVWLDTIAPMIGFVVGITSTRMSFGNKTKIWLLLYLLSSFLFNGVSNIVSEFFDMNNHVLYHSENLLNFIFLSLFFFHLPALQRYQQFIKFITILFVVAGITYKLVEVNYFIFDSSGFVWSSILFTLYALAFYNGLIQGQKGENLFKLPDFWMVTGVFFYYASCFFIFILYRHYTNLGITNTGMLWRFQNIMLSIMCIFIIKGFLCRASRTSPLLL